MKLGLLTITWRAAKTRFFLCALVQRYHPDVNTGLGGRFSRSCCVSGFLACAVLGRFCDCHRLLAHALAFGPARGILDFLVAGCDDCGGCIGGGVCQVSTRTIVLPLLEHESDLAWG